MERPGHLHVEKKSAANRATSLAIVIAIHIAGIAGLVAALSSGALIKQLQEIKATVDTQKTPPKAPPPPPPDLVKPSPPAIRCARSCVRIPSRPIRRSRCV